MEDQQWVTKGQLSSSRCRNGKHGDTAVETLCLAQKGRAALLPRHLDITG